MMTRTHRFAARSSGALGLSFGLLAAAFGGACGGASAATSATATVATATATVAGKASPPLAAGDTAPAFHVASTDGRVFDSAALVGKPVVLVFFTSWCPVCGREMPIVERVVSEAGDSVTALGVALDDEDSWGKVPAYVTEKKITFPIVQGSANPALTGAYDPQTSFPVVVVVDARGKIALVQNGAADDSGAALQAKIAAAK